jgi:hypothetical protein
LAILVALNPVAGDHVKLAAPVAFNVVLLPEQIETPEPALTALPPTVTVTVETEVQFPLTAVKEYVVVTVGVATGFKIVVELKPVLGAHE